MKMAAKAHYPPEPGRPELDAAVDIGTGTAMQLLENGGAFPFVCAGCGDCCRRRRDLLLSGFDLYRIARRLRLPPAMVAEAFCKKSIGAETCLPALRLAPRGKEGNCPFLESSSCAIHEARPLACALYPLGQTIDTETGRADYYAQLPLCGAVAEGSSLRQYLANAGIDVRLGNDVQWAKQCMALSQRLLAGGGQANPRFAATARRVEKALYYDYTLRDDWYPQFRENLAVLNTLLEKLGW